MRKLLFILALALPLAAQTTTSVTATLTDSDGTTWANATCTTVLQYQAQYPPQAPFIASSHAAVPLNPACTVNGSGTLSATLTDVQWIASQFKATWQFTVCPNVFQGITGCGVTNIPVTGTSQNVTSLLNLPAPRVGGGVGSHAYADVKVAAVYNNFYWNTTTGDCRQFTTSWGACGGGGYDSRPRATTSAVGVTIAASSSCVLSISPATAGQQTVSSCNTGTPAGPGTITHIHLTLGPGGDNANVLQNSTLTIACDGNAQTVPLGLFFLTEDNPKPFSTDWTADTLGNSSGGNFSGNRRMEVNFNSGCTVTFTNASSSQSVILFGEVDYRLGANVSRSTRKYWHVVTQPLTSVSQYANFSMLPTVTAIDGGELESITLFGSSANNPDYLEGYTSVTVDGNEAVQANGTEDFFGSGYYGINSVGGHYSPKWGEFYSSGVGANPSLQNPAGTYDTLLYRNFETDDVENAIFTNNLAVTQPNGENGKPGASPPGTVSMSSMVTYWTHDPYVINPTFSPPAGTVSSGTAVTMATATSGATICYTTDGTTPTTNGAGICTHGTAGTSTVVNPPETVNAIATKQAYADSPDQQAVYSATGSSGYTFSTSTFANNGVLLLQPRPPRP
jgi:hypothetical protein